MPPTPSVPQGVPRRIAYELSFSGEDEEDFSLSLTFLLSVSFCPISNLHSEEGKLRSQAAVDWQHEKSITGNTCLC